jgi:hypothetical protein
LLLQCYLHVGEQKYFHYFLKVQKTIFRRTLTHPEDLIELSFLQYNVVYNLFSLTIAVMFAAGIYFLATAGRIVERYRPAMYVSALIVFVAGYRYFRIFGSWDAAFDLTSGGGLQSEGTYTAAADQVFNEAY